MTVSVPADKIRTGDVVALCEGFEPDCEITAAEYDGWRSGLNSVYLEIDGSVFPADGFRRRGVVSPDKCLYVAVECAEEIRVRPTAMDEFYGKTS